jgi:phosphoadenosine phosphosulfate reductase
MKQTLIDIPEMTLEWLVGGAAKLMWDFEPPEGYWGCFSGGKDSVVIKTLAERANVKVHWVYNVTTIDPPEIVRFIRDVHPDVEFLRPERNFFAVAEKRGFPTRRARWCCEEFKESKNPPGATLLTGIRAAESGRRARDWAEVKGNTRTGGRNVNPIFRWSDDDVWRFIHETDIPYCSLYDEGWKRLGCIGCPMSRDPFKQFERWPGFEKLWKRLFMRVWERRTGSIQRNGKIWFGDAYFRNWEEMWGWWVSRHSSLPAKLVPDKREIYETFQFEYDEDEACTGIAGLLS